MTSCFLKIWKWLAGAIAFTILLFLWFDPPSAGGLFWSFVNAESSMAFWNRKMNLPFWVSFGIATACSGFVIFTWFCLFTKAKTFYDTLARPLYNELKQRTDLGTINGNAEWVRTVYRFCCDICTLLIPRPTEVAGEKKTIRRILRRYAPLLAYGFVPTCVWMGVGYSLSFRLNMFASWFILTIGDAVKIAFFGYLAVKIPFWSVLPMFFVGPMIIRYVTDRFMKRGN
jgi:hypothetical protein